MEDFYDENNNLIPYDSWETQEQADAKKFIRKDDVVLELGARWGGVSCVINNELENKKNHVAVEPDSTVWRALEKNRDNHNCEFQIIKGAISKQSLSLDKTDTRWNGLATIVKRNKKGKVPIYDIPDMHFNVLVADCEGFLEIFYNENKEFFKSLRLILVEEDRPDMCNYERLRREFKELGFDIVRQGFHSVFIRYKM